MARAQKTEDAPVESAAQNTPTEAPEVLVKTETPEAPVKTRNPVKLVLQGAHQIAAEVADDDDAAPARRGRTSALNDAIQATFDAHVALSWERGRMLTLKVPAEAEREAVKRLRHAANQAGHGLWLGNVRPDPTDDGIVRVPFQAKVKKQYKPRGGKTSAE